MGICRQLTDTDLAICLDQAASGFHVGVQYIAGRSYGHHTWKVEPSGRILDLSGRCRYDETRVSSVAEINQFYIAKLDANCKEVSIECFVPLSISGACSSVRPLHLDVALPSPVALGP
jgi:hypothetical protein